MDPYDKKAVDDPDKAHLESGKNGHIQIEELEGAQSAATKEHAMPLGTAIKAYYPAILWSIVLSLGVVCEGYDTILMGSLLAYPSFINQFANTATAAGDRQISAPWQAALVNGAYIGEILGLWLTGLAVDKYGNKKVMFGALVMLEAFTFLSVFGMNLPTQLAGQILCGLPWGTFQTLSVVYASECLPIHLRGYLTSYVNLCWVIGQLIASGILVAFVNRVDNLGWQIPFAIQFVFPIPIFIAVIFCPESPTWLVKQGRLEDALTAVRRLRNEKVTHPAIPEAEETVALLVKTDKYEKAIEEGATYRACFTGAVNLRRTEIACLTWIAQELPGVVLLSYATTFFVQAGLPTEQAFNMNVGLYALGFVGTILSWPLLRYFGRRQIFVSGQAIMFFILLAIGGAGCAKQSTAVSWVTGSLLLLLTFFYDITLGPVTYAIVPEIPSSRLRTKTTVLSRNGYNIACIVVGVLSPYQLNPTAWNWGAKTGFFWAGFALLCFLWSFFRLPETKDRTFYEIDHLFEEKVPARKFKTTHVD